MRSVGCNLPKMENLEPRLFLTAAVVESAFDGDYSDKIHTASLVELAPTGESSLDGQISTRKDRDYIKFIAPLSGGMQITMAGENGDGLDSRLYAYNSRRRKLASNNNISKLTKDARVTFAVEAGQTYYVLARAKGKTSGAYSLAVNTAEDDFGGSLAGAGQVSLAAGQTTTITSGIDYAKDRDFIQFTAQVAGGLTVRMQGQGQLDPYLIGYNQQGRKRAKNNNISRDTTDAGFTMQVQAGATYYIQAAGRSKTAGEYSLSLSLAEEILLFLARLRPC